jgi:dipeptidyl aminopeptidase/acylaminoacyl peptidase
MHRRCNLAGLILASALVLGLTPLVVDAVPQAQIVFASERDGNMEIYVMDADGKNHRKLTRNPANDVHPSWSPDGERIVFVSHRDGNYEIYVMNADGARQVRRRTRDGSDDTNPAWFDPAFAVEVVPFVVSPRGKQFTMWGWLKQVAR